MNYSGGANFENELNDNGQDRKPASNAKLMQLIGPDFKFTPFEEGWFLPLR
jgi:GDP-L-fucose synthase